jgi:hypothetical protein
MRDHTGDTITVTLTDFDESGMACDNVYTLSGTDTIDISGISTTFDSTTTIDTSAFDDLVSLDDITLTINDPVEFEDQMPSVAKVEDMCNDYPALAKAYENFKTIYAMVHQDWKGRQEAENQLPF